MAACNKEGKNENPQGGKIRNHSWVEKIHVSSSENRFALSKVHHELKGDIPKITVPSELMASFSPRWLHSLAGAPTPSHVVKEFTTKEWKISGLEIGMKKEGDCDAIGIPLQHPSPDPISNSKNPATDIESCSSFAGGDSRPLPVNTDISGMVPKESSDISEPIPDSMLLHIEGSTDTALLSNLHILPLLGRKAKKAKRKKEHINLAGTNQNSQSIFCPHNSRCGISLLLDICSLLGQFLSAMLAITTRVDSHETGISMASLLHVSSIHARGHHAQLDLAGSCCMGHVNLLQEPALTPFCCCLIWFAWDLLHALGPRDLSLYVNLLHVPRESSSREFSWHFLHDLCCLFM